MSNAWILMLVAVLLVGGEIGYYLYRTRRRLRTVGLYTITVTFALAFADALLLRLLAAALSDDVGNWPALSEAVMWLAGFGLVVSLFIGVFLRWTLRTDISDIPGADKSDPPVSTDDRPLGF